MPALSAKESPVQMKSLAVTEVRVGDVLNRREAVTIHGKPVEIPDKERLDTYSSAGMRLPGLQSAPAVHRPAARRCLAAGIREVVVFHSSAETMLEFQGQLPFEAIADPGRKLYGEFGVEKKMSPHGSTKPCLLYT